jgi:hypothetical protein
MCDTPVNVWGRHAGCGGGVVVVAFKSKQESSLKIQKSQNSIKQARTSSQSYSFIFIRSFYKEST